MVQIPPKVSDVRINGDVVGAGDVFDPAIYGQVERDGSLRLVTWSEAFIHDGMTNLILDGLEVGPQKMAHAHGATGTPLVSNGHLGVDLIHVQADHGFEPHTHPGDHLLIPVAGQGTITYDGRIYPTRAGQVYMIEGKIPHAVGAITDHKILAVGAPHRPVGSPDRMKPVEYREIVSHTSTLHCLICDVKAHFPDVPHTKGCTHCPCHECTVIRWQS